MSKKIWLIRHGESSANAGAATLDHKTIPLTEFGQEQARQVSLLFEQPPDIIITSPFDRARQTAYPTLKRFHGVKQQVWPVQEFTYLAPASCVNTTADERRERVNKYWNRLDPDYIDGEGAESFRQFLYRAQLTIERLDRINEELIVMFTHAQFIRSMRMLRDNKGRNVQQLMSIFRSLPRIENCEITKWE